MFSFFKKKFNTDVDYSFLKTDMHSHLIAGIDDGAKTIEDSIAMIRSLSDMGFQKIITTPHIFIDYYPNKPENILPGLALLRAALKKENIAVELDAAAEYFMDDHFEDLLKAGTPLLTFGEKHILFECSMLAESKNLYNIIFQLKTQQYNPILAHPERYTYYGNQFEEYEKIKNHGCALQVNLLSLTGYYGKLQKDLGFKLIKAGLVDYLGTDLHNQKQIEYLKKPFTNKKVYDILHQHTFKNIEL